MINGLNNIKLKYYIKIKMKNLIVLCFGIGKKKSSQNIIEDLIGTSDAEDRK